MSRNGVGTLALEIKGLNVFYGQSHAVQGVDLQLGSGVLSVVGRNGMGKTTLCKAIMGLEPVASGSVSFYGQSLNGMSPTNIARLGIGYVPQGRRLWPSLTVDEHLKLVVKRGSSWSVGRIYDVFPRLAERKNNGGGQLSGGEQQMLAIGRALLLNPKLLLMDEPTEGLAPVIVSQVADMLIQLSQDGEMDILMIEQNIGVACAVSDRVAIMVNGRINRVMDSSLLANDKGLQQSLLGVGRHAHDEQTEKLPIETPTNSETVSKHAITRIYMSNPQTPDRWSQAVSVKLIEQSALTRTPTVSTQLQVPIRKDPASGRQGIVYVCGTLDTKADELRFIKDAVKAHGLRVHLLDLSTSGKPSGAEIPPSVIAGFHPRGFSAVFTGDRGTSVAGMTTAFVRWMQQQNNVAGVIAAGGSGGTALVAEAFRSLPIGVPKLIISTVASGNVTQYVGSSDMLMMHSVADVQGLNTITKEVLRNGADALAGMVRSRKKQVVAENEKAAVAMTMFGVTTQCVSMISNQLESDYDCLVFHATGTGGRSMEKLIESRKLSAYIDLTTTEVADYIGGGVFAADETRFDAAIESGKPFIGACGALDMVNFNAPETVPEKYSHRLFYEHNPHITLMRTSVEECHQIGQFIGEKINRMNSPVRFFLNEGGISALDKQGEAFWDPAANAALFSALEKTVNQTVNRQLVRVPFNINEPEFADLVVATFRSFYKAPNANQNRA